MPRRTLFSHEQLCGLVDVELSIEEEYNELYRQWKQSELEDLWREIKRIELIRLRRIAHRKEFVEQTLGIRLSARVPKKLIDPPARLRRLFHG